jgi:hypothetical protein
MKNYSRGELKDKVSEYMKQKREPVCYHIISADFDIPDANAYMALRRAEKQGVAVRCSMKGTCQWSKQAHTMFVAINSRLLQVVADGMDHNDKDNACDVANAANPR